MQSAITSNNIYNPDPVVTRALLLQVFLGLVAAGLFFAFWQLCSDQVRRGEARNAELRNQQMAFADCLQSVPRSTFASCKVRTVAASPETITASSTAPVTGAIPVSHVYR